MKKHTAADQKVTLRPSLATPSSLVLQRKCARGNQTMPADKVLRSGAGIAALERRIRELRGGRQP